MMRFRGQLWTAVAVLGIPAPTLLAQGQLPRGAQRVDPGIGDVGAVEGVSRVDLFRDLRHERGFGTVYRFESRQPMGMPGATSTMYMRMDGGITAVFPESVYYNSPWELSPTVPPGTTFYIGRLPEHFGSAPALPPRASNYVDTRVNLMAHPQPPSINPPESAASSAAPTIWEDEAYRQRALARLMRRAAATGR
jgi:hypothetical protein